MAKVKVRYYVCKPGRAGAVRRFWEPSARLRSAGWRQTRLDDAEMTAIAQAQEINGAVDAWRGGALAEPALALRAIVISAAPAAAVKGDVRSPDGGDVQPALRPGTL